jgi:hypothetical protein
MRIKPQGRKARLTDITSKILMRLAAGGALVTMKRRAVNQLTEVKNFPVLVHAGCYRDL